MTGTTPPGVTGEQAAGNWVRGIFARIAGHYDLLNHLLSFNLDRRWRARLVARAAESLNRPGASALDLCCGTADVLLALEQENKNGTPLDTRIFGSDFCHPMLMEAARKITAARVRSPLFEADALLLPVRDQALDLVTIAFGFRNLANYDKGLDEILRVLKPGGLAAILEFSRPTNPIFGIVYGFFSTRILPWVGGAISGSREAYSYLPGSIRKFPDADALAMRMRAAGFRKVEVERMTGGAVALHLAWK